jgi:hypothetical protein
VADQTGVDDLSSCFPTRKVNPDDRGDNRNRENGDTGDFGGDVLRRVFGLKCLGTYDISDARRHENDVVHRDIFCMDAQLQRAV